MEIYNRDTFLNEGYVQYINYLIIGLIILGAFFSETIDLFDINVIISLYFASLALSIVLSERVAKKIAFVEDESEEKNRLKFKYRYFIVCSALCFLLSISVYCVYECDLFWIYWIPVIVFSFNIAFIPNLYYPLFEDCLPQFI